MVEIIASAGKTPNAITVDEIDALARKHGVLPLGKQDGTLAVAVANPSHSVRPGSFTCTWLSTSPGSSTSPSARVTALAGASL